MPQVESKLFDSVIFDEVIFDVYVAVQILNAILVVLETLWQPRWIPVGCAQPSFTSERVLMGAVLDEEVIL